MKGFSLIEVLIALIIMAIASVGLGQLELLSLKNNQSSSIRSQANLISSDMIDKMRLNSSVANLYLSTIVSSEAGADELLCNQCQSLSLSCIAVQLVVLDMCVWQARLSKLGSGAVAVISKNNTVYSINISWDESVANVGTINNISNPRAQLLLSFIL